MNIFFFLLPISAFLGPAISWGDFYLYHFTALTIAIYFLINPKILKQLVMLNLQINKIWITIFTYSLLSLAWTPNLNDGLKYCAYLGCGVFLIFVMPFIFDTKKKTESLMKILGYLYGAHLILALIEIYTPLRWPISEYSHLAKYFGRNILLFPDFFENYPTSFFWHQNNCALVTLIALPLLPLLKKSLSIIAFLLSYLVIFYTGSKSIIVISGFYGLYFASKHILSIKGFANLGRIVAGFLAISLLGYYFSNSEQQGEFKTSLETVANYARPLGSFFKAKIIGEEFDFSQLHGNIRERFYFMDGAIDLLKKSPILGIGAGGNLSALYTKNGQNLGLGSIHNFWLEMLVTFGPILFILYLYWLIGVIKTKSEFNISLILFVISVPVLSSAIYFLPMWLLYALCVIKNKRPSSVTNMDVLS